MFQQVILIGNATRDTELRYTPSGTAVADVGIAINKRVKKNGVRVAGRARIS